jgi:alpha-tubulin suppressor-like RCC1 family protein
MKLSSTLLLLLALLAAACGGSTANSQPTVHVPGAPTSVAATRGNGEAQVTWAPPASDGGDAITAYTVTSAPGGLTVTVDGSATFATVTGLTNGAAYTFTVVATNSVGDSPASAPSNAVTPATVPDAPTSVAAARIQGQVHVSWTAPTSDGGDAITGYTVTSAPGGLTAQVDGSTFTATVEGLTDGTPYTFTVVATNSVGDSPASAPSNAVTPFTPPANLGYAQSPAVYTMGLAITDNAPSSTGGSVDAYAISPALPAGLSFDTTTGVISGTPESTSPATDYTVVASNEGGTAQAVITLTVRLPEIVGGEGVLSAGTNYACAVLSGAAWCWGSNVRGQLGDGTATARATPTPVVGLTQGVQSIATGTNVTCAVVDGAAWCWGMNHYSQLGDGTTTDSKVPVQVSGLTSGVESVAMGLFHVCALVNGGVWCWGNNTYGQLGDGTAPSPSSVPVQVAGLTSGVQAIAAGQWHTCALVNGNVVCWGANYSGQLGDGTTNDSTTPVQVSGLTGEVTSVSAGNGHTCAAVDGGAWCWGDNAAGQLGNGSTTASSAPVQVSGLTGGVQSVSLGGDSGCAVVNGGLQCWGDNTSGQLGDGTTTSSSVPVQVSGLTGGVQTAAAGSDLTCAHVQDGVRCWGANTHGELGNGTTTNSLTPVQVSNVTGGN